MSIGKTVQAVTETDYAQLAGRLFGVPDLPIDAARQALAQR